MLAALGGLHRARDHPPGQPGQGGGHPTGLEASGATSCSSRTPTSSTTPSDWPGLLDPILKGKSQIVYGSRFTGERKNMFPSHWLGNRFLTLVTNILYRSTLSDMETCYKLFDRRVLAGITIRSERFDFEPEITAKVLRRRLPDLRGPHLLHRPRARRGQEDHLARRLRRHGGARPLPLHPDRPVTPGGGADGQTAVDVMLLRALPMHLTTSLPPRSVTSCPESEVGTNLVITLPATGLWVTTSAAGPLSIDVRAFSPTYLPVSDDVVPAGTTLHLAWSGTNAAIRWTVQIRASATPSVSCLQ